MKKNLIVNGLEIFYKDLPPRTLFKAKALCSALRGGDWRLPTHEELMYLYDLHKLGILGFKDTLYWSHNKNDQYSFSVNFKDGKSKLHRQGQFNEFNIRPVRRREV